MHKKQNILYAFLLFLIYISIGIFNYLVDPYDIFHKKPTSIRISKYPRELYSSILKLSKNNIYKHVVIGSSTAKQLLNDNVYPFFEEDKQTLYITTDNFDYYNQIKYLDFLLKINPEIENIIITIEYPFFSTKRNFKQINIPSNEKLGIKEQYDLLFSMETIKRSYKKLKGEQEKDTKGTNKNITITTNINWGKEQYKVFYKRNFHNGFLIDYNENDYSEFEKLQKITENRNLIFIFPPYHALLQGIIYIKNQHKKVENIKQYMVNKFPNAKIIDFAFINKYTAEPLETTDNYPDIIHPLGHVGHIFYCSLMYQKEFEDKDIFVYLSKENIDNILEEQNEKLKNYTNKNMKIITEFMKNQNKDKNLYINKEFTPPKNCNYYLKNI